MALETNIFGFIGLRGLNTECRLYAIRGLSKDHDEYHENRSAIARILSYRMKSPATTIEIDDEPYLVLRDGDDEPASPLQLVRGIAHFDKVDRVLTLDFGNPSQETADICRRFLQWAVDTALYSNQSLWRPGAGRPFFEKKPRVTENGIDVFRGFSVRVVRIADREFGVCIDVVHRYVSHNPLPPRISKIDFRGIKGSSCVYRFGSQWYEIRLHEHSGLTVSDYMIDTKSLGEYIGLNAKGSTSLAPDTDALKYFTNTGDVRAAPSTLCYLSYDTKDPRVRRMHKYTIPPPHVRRSAIHDFAKNCLQTVKTRGQEIRIGMDPVRVAVKLFSPPDLLFGNGKILSCRGSLNCIQCTLEDLGKNKLRMLTDPTAGPYSNNPLERQYFIMPESLAERSGKALLSELKRIVDTMLPSEIEYDPEIITYDDRGDRTLGAQGKAILDAVDSRSLAPGYGIVMIHEISAKRPREQDQLALAMMRKLRDRGIYASVIHSTFCENYFSPNSQSASVASTAGKASSYVKNVVLSKVLITNERWPFVLGTPLHADLVVGIDVKENTCCYTVIAGRGREVSTRLSTSNNKERLSKDQVQTTFQKLLRDVADKSEEIRTISIHRDGKLFPSEIAGIENAVKLASRQSLGGISPEVKLTLVEIPKTSAASFRFFDIQDQTDRPQVRNPRIGCFHTLNDTDSYLCTTGYPFSRQGTARPLHVRIIRSGMPPEHAIEDVFSLTSLTWTKPDDCLREPMTIKLTDIRLEEHAGTFDEDAIDYSPEVEEGIKDE
jgi:hypothetical protein